MHSKGFSIGEALKFGWEQWKKNWQLFLALTVFAFFVPMIPQAFLMTLSDEAVFSHIILSLIYFVFTAFCEMGLLVVALKAARNEPFVFSDFFSKIHRFPSYIWGKFLFILSVGLGLLFLIVPGIIIAIKFNLWPFFVLDKDKPGFDSLKFSNQATSGVKWDLFGFLFALLLINALGILAFGVGLLITSPVSLIALAKVYLQLTEEPKGEIS